MIKLFVYCYSLVVLLNTCCARGQETSSKGRTYISDPDVGVEYLRASEPLKLRCVQENGDDLEWYRGSMQIKEDDTSQGFYIASSVDKGMQVSTLHKKEHTNRNDSGRYHCQPVGRPSDAIYIDVVVYEIVATNHVIKKNYEDVQLQCLIGDLPSGVTVQSVSWVREGATVANVERQFKVEVHESKLNTTLRVNFVQQHLAGNYTCVFVLSTTLSANATISIDAVPQVRFADRSVNLVEGENLMTQCILWGVPRPTVTWFVLQEGAPTSDMRPLVTDSRISVTSDDNYLSIANVTRADRAIYWCFATNAHGVNNATILLRVKGKYAAVWPFIGVVLEVIALVVIITTYECYRARKRREEEAADRAEYMTSLTNEHNTASDVQHDDSRYRKKEA